VLQHAAGFGDPCIAPTAETAGCKETSAEVPAVVSCGMSDWAEWQLCDRSCGGGQTVRKRRIEREASLGGTACSGGLQETTSCGLQPCSLSLQPCRAASWSEWGDCSSTCGPGNQARSRSYSEAAAGGRGCSLPLSESRGCADLARPQCTIQDCVVSEWSEWHTCSKTCMGGITERFRKIVTHASIGGKACQSGDLLEVTGCGSGSCDVENDCQDGKWGDWQGWTECTKSCSGGYKWTSRRIDQEANKCGTPVTGPAIKAERCHDNVTCAGAVDCQLSTWSLWTTCKHPCTGVRDRSRQIKVHTKDGGSPCATDLAEVEHCPAAPGTSCEPPTPHGCKLSDWAEWSACPATCGGAQTTRTREAIPGPDGSLIPCEGVTSETAACGESPCGAKVDCQYSEWDAWGNCTKCGGQQFRHRAIAQKPAFGGADCKPEEMTQTEPCKRDCGDKLYWCEWSEWSGFSGCTKSCGAGLRFRKKLMSTTETKPEHPLAVASTSKECEGKIVDVEACPDLAECDPCTPEDCVIGDWAEWGAPSCEGLCMRSRVVARENNACGKPCSGSLNSTKPCEATCGSQDCHLSDWSSWTNCSSDLDQKYKWRSITQMPLEGGKACDGVQLNLSSSCMTGVLAPVDCAMSQWTEWGSCSETCGSGQQARSREVVSPAARGGQACHDSLAMTRACNPGTCSETAPSTGLVDCQLGPWSTWMECDQTDQQLRVREVLHPALGVGEPCQGSLKQTRGCGEESGSRNCIFSTWNEWSSCPMTCGGSQSSRSRVIESHAHGGGLQCEGTMLETHPCGEGACPGALSLVCEYSEWNSWGACSRTCGEGFKNRVRIIANPAVDGREGCRGNLAEVAPCDNACNPGVDCQWGDWASWSQCVKAPDTCGIGFKSRGRKIAVMPQQGGQLCPPRHMSEVLPVSNCQGQLECCIDAQWSDWNTWGPCSATCGSGTHKREREVKIKETWCGKPAAGSPVEYGGCSAQPCEANVDCAFSEWSTPTACSSVCHGRQIRTRTIVRNSTGTGLPCNGSTIVSDRCNPAPGQEEPLSCKTKEAEALGVQDCIMSRWSDWSPCSATCERGYQVRERHIEVEAERGGKPCEPQVKELNSCHAGVTCFPERVDCVWEAWTAWGACDAFDKMTRTRGIAKHAFNGGLQCKGSFIEIKGCHEDGSEHCPPSWYNCSYSSWTEWTPCSKTCGRESVRGRVRSLEVSHDSVPAPVDPITTTTADPYEYAYTPNDYDMDAAVNGEANTQAESQTSEQQMAQLQGQLEDNMPAQGQLQEEQLPKSRYDYVAPDAEATDLTQYGPRSWGTYHVSEESLPLLRKYDLTSLETKVKEVEMQRAKELRTAFVLGAACLAVVGFVVRSGILVRRRSTGEASLMQLPQYDAVPQNA